MLRYFAGGLSMTCISGAILMHWWDLMPYSPSDLHPAWVGHLETVAGGFPFAILLLLMIARIQAGPSIKAGSYCAGVLAPYFVVFAWIIGKAEVVRYQHMQEFNSESWLAPEDPERDFRWPVRLCMADDLLAGGDLDGLTRAEVFDLLGAPYSVDSDPRGSGDTLEYYLGPAHDFFGMDSDILSVQFSDEDVVSEVWVSTR